MTKFKGVDFIQPGNNHISRVTSRLQSHPMWVTMYIKQPTFKTITNKAFCTPKNCTALQFITVSES